MWLRHFAPTGLSQFLLKNLLEPIGQIFLRSLFMVVIPLVLSSLIVGVARLGNMADIRRMGLRLGLFYFATTLAAILLGQILVVSFKPGQGLDPQMMESARLAMGAQVGQLIEKSQSVPESLWPGIISSIIPKNIIQAFSAGDMLAVIFVGLIFGLSLTQISRDKCDSVILFFDAISDASVKIVGWIMKMAPIAVAALVSVSVVRLGAGILQSVSFYFSLVVAGYLIHLFVFYPLVMSFLGLGISPKTFFKKSMPVFMTSFSTSSSNATLPTTIATMENSFGVPPSIARFALPLGATVNMDGTALFEMMAAIFIAQVFGVHLGPVEHMTLIVLVLVTSVGVAGVPGGSTPLLMSAMAVVGIPVEGIALILGVDRLLDMGRTVVNVTGDMVGALYLAKSEGVLVGAKLSEVDSPLSP